MPSPTDKPSLLPTERPRLRGLYAITPAHRGEPQQLADQVAEAIAGGARLVQYRDKSGRRDKRHDEARQLGQLCARTGVGLIINDDIALADAVAAAGVHLGRDDPDIGQARALLGAQAIIGVSCYDSPQRALDAACAGADYLAFGRFFPSRSKPQARPADPAVLTRMRATTDLPLVAIGGITIENAGLLIAAGADMLAVIDGIFGPHRDSIGSRCRSISRLFANPASADEPPA
jgi:thiamine-phosphate pyrophosphorylase